MKSMFLYFSLLFAPLVTAFSFSAGTPTECDNLSISWSGGAAPFFLHLIPIFGTPRNITIPANAFSNGKGSYSISQLPIAQGKQFLLSMSDATGFATGGTTDVLTAGSSQGGRCSTQDPGPDFSFQLNSLLVQCQPYVFDGYPDAIQPVSIYGLIPSGTSFALQPPPNAASFSWTADVEHGTSIVFMMADSAGRQGGASNVKTVANSNDQSCLNGNSPSSTSAAPTTTQARPTDKRTSSSSAPTSSPSAPASSGGTSAGAIAGTVIGILLFVAVVVTLGMFFLKKRKEAKKAPAGTSGFPSYGGGFGPGHTNGYTLSSATTPAYGTSPHAPYTPPGSQTYNPQTSWGTEPSYGHTYQPSQYAPNTYASSAQVQHNHNHTLSGGTFGAYDGHQGSMLPYDADPFLDNPHEPQQYPPANYAYQSTYQLPSASAYTLPHPADPFNPLMTDRRQSIPPHSFATAENASTVDSSTTTAQQRKAAMAGKSSYKGSSHIVVHTDAEDVLPHPNADGVVELPPQYSERRGGGLAVVNQSPPSPTSSVTPLPPQRQPYPQYNHKT